MKLAFHALCLPPKLVQKHMGVNVKGDCLNFLKTWLLGDEVFDWLQDDDGDDDDDETAMIKICLLTILFYRF